MILNTDGSTLGTAVSSLAQFISIYSMNKLSMSFASCLENLNQIHS